jgi:hypothetical protein
MPDTIANDRRVRELIAQQERGQPISFADAWSVCSYRSLLGPDRARLSPDTTPSACVVVLGLTPDDFCAELRDDIVATLRVGETVLLLSNSAALRDHAKAEILLAMATPGGVA